MTAPLLQGRDYFQVPQPFDLPEAATAPDGRVFTGHRARVYWLLRITRERGHRHPVGRHLGPPGAVPVHLLREPWSGGQSGGRRARELREYGCELAIEPFEPPDGRGSATTMYSLTRDPIAGDAAAADPGRRSEAGGPPTQAAPRLLAPLDGATSAPHAVAALPRSHGRQPGQPAGPSAAAGGGSAGTLERSAAARPLVGLRVRLQRDLGHPRALASGEKILDLTPSRGQYVALAPAVDVVDEQGYLEQLNQVWHSGDLVRQLELRRPQVCLYLRTELPFDLWPVVRRVLTACGAGMVEDVAS